MKKLVLSLLMSGLLFTGFAQENKDVKPGGKKKVEHRDPKFNGLADKSPEEIAKLKTDRLDEKLKFTDKQRKEIYVLNLQQAKKDKTLFEQRKKEQQKLAQERKTEREKMLKILTPEQRELMKNGFAENRKNRFQKDGVGRKRTLDKGSRNRIKSDIAEHKVS